MALTKIVASRSGRRTTLIPFSGIIDDGSTLSLDFTTGHLDPRLTFTRASTATFINNSGLVEWAAANMMTRSQSQDDNAYWNAFGTAVTRTGGQTDPFGGTGAVKLVFNAISAAVVISRTVSVSQGLPYTLSIWMRADSGTVNNIRLGRGAAAAGAYTPTLTTAWQRYSLSFVATTASDGIELRLLFKGTPDTATFHVFGAQLEPGSTMRDYNPALLDVPYHAPRFDYDPDTLAPKGLLIEGTATSLCRSSNDTTNATYWTLQTAYAATSATGGTAPDGTNTGNLFTEPTTSAQRSIYQAISSPAGTHTGSVWIKGGTGSTRYIRLVVSSGSGDFGYVTVNATTGAIQQAATTVGTATSASATVTPYPSGWTRVTLTVTLASSLNFCFLVPMDFGSIDTPTGNYGRVSYLGDGSTFLVWGAQVETGSGASSYIPTGASTVQRLGDSCVMTGANFSSWFAGATEGVLYAELERPRSQSGSLVHDHAAVGTRYSSGAAWIVYATQGNLWPTTLLWPTGGAIFPGGFPSTIPLVSKQAARWFDGNDATNFANGLQGTTGAGSGTLTPTMLSIGASSTTGTQADRDWLNACVRRVKFWPVALPNAQIIALTT